jgi:hypothetical protein
MSPADQLALAWQSLLFVVRQMTRPALWAPWAILAGLQAGAVVALSFAAHPWLSPVLAPLVRRLAGESALRYPDLFLALSGLYARVDLVLAALVGAVTLGASAALFRDVALARRPSARAALALALRRAPALIAVQLPYHMLALGWSNAVVALLGVRGGLMARAAFVIALLGVVVAQALFLYAAAFVIVERRGAFGTLRSLPHGWRHGIWAALPLCALMVLPLLPLHFLSGLGPVIAERGRPELLAILALTQIAIAAGTGFLLSGAATLVFVGGIARAGAGEARR